MTDKDEILEIIEYLEYDSNLSEDEIENAYKALGDLNNQEAIPYLMESLKKFDNLSWQIRNVIALSLGKLGAEQALPILMKVVNDNRFKGMNGSFLYAIAQKPLECKEYFLNFVELLCTGSLEVRAASFKLIKFYQGKIEYDIKLKASDILRNNRIIFEAKNIEREEQDSLSYIEQVEDLLGG